MRMERNCDCCKPPMAADQCRGADRAECECGQPVVVDKCHTPNHVEKVNLGAVSAYAVAKKHGFTGTEAEWEAYIANASIKAQEAARDAASAAASAADARSSLGQIRDQNEGLFLRYDEPASLTEENKAQVRENIGLTYTETEAVSFLGEVAAVEGSVAVYADIPGYWRVSTGSLDTNNWSVHTRMISIKGFEKVYGRAWMRDYGYYVAYFDENYQLMEDISLVGGLSDAMSNFRFGNNSESEPLDLASAKAAGACYISISSAGSSTDYPYIFWGKPVSAPVQEGFDPGIHDIGRVESHGVSYADFGARLDGEHDDTDAVIACHEYANAHGCPVYQHKGTVRMKTARHRYHGARHNAQIKTDVDWTGTTFLILPEDQGTDDQGNPLDNGEQIAFSVTPEVDYEDVRLTAEQIAELHDDWLNIPFLKTSYPNEIVTFSTTDIVIGRRDGEETYTAPSYYSETVTADRNGGLMDGHMFRDMTECEHVTMAHRSIMDHPITIKGGTFLRGTGNRFVNPYYLYITRSNVTIQGLKVDAGTRHETGDRAYRGELIRANYAYNLCFRDCVCENFSTFFPWADRYNNNVCYVLVCTHCSNVLIDHCNFLRGWGPMQTSWCKHVTVRNSTMGRVDNHYGCRDYLIEGCTMVTSHSNINVGYGDGYLTIRDCKFIKTRDYDTMMNSRIVYCREDMCAIFSGDITIENIQIESDYETTVLYAALESTWEFKAESTNQILPMKLPKVRMRNIYFRRAGWTEGHQFTLLEYGVNRSASAVLYGYIMADNAVIDGVYSDMEARVLPMLEHVTLTGDEPWIIKVRNYNCEVQVTKDINIDPDENMDFNLPLVMLLPDPDVNFQQQIDALSRQDSQESAREAKEAEIGAQESQRKAAMSQTHAHEEAVRASRSQTAAAESQTDAAASAEAAASSETNAASSETNAAASEAAAAASAAAAQAVLDSIPADYTAMAQDVGDLKSALESIVTDDNFIELTKTSDIFSTEEGAVANRYGKNALAGYVLCTMTAEKDFDFYASGPILESTRAIYISIYNDEISGANYQASQSYGRTAQGGTLPTENSKGHVYKGQTFAVSVYTPASNAGDFIINANCAGYRLSNDTVLNEKQIEQVISELPPDGSKFANFADGKKIAWFGDSISELKSLPHIAGSLMGADVYDCSIRGSTIGRTYSNYDEFSFYRLVTAVISGDFSAQFAQLDAYEQAQGRTYPGIRENLTTLSNLDFSTVDYVVLLQGTNDFGITAVHAAEGYATKAAEMQVRMDDAISRFITAYPKLKFYIISPPFRATPTEDYYGDTLADYVAAEKEVAEKYAIPFYDLLISSRICDQNKTAYMLSDGGVYVHPNDDGDAWLAELCAKFISVH